LELEQIIHECQRQNRKAQEQLYKTLSPKVFAVCLKYSRNYEEAQDNLQEGFLLIFEKINKYQFKGSFEGWAKRVVINYILQQYRAKKGVLEILTDEFVETQNEEIEKEEDIPVEYLNTIIQQLPERYRLVFNLYVIDDFSHKEIAKMLEISEGTSKSNLARAKGILKNKIENYSLPLNKIVK